MGNCSSGVGPDGSLSVDANTSLLVGALMVVGSGREREMRADAQG